jgi:hypothetical protein
MSRILVPLSASLVFPDGMMVTIGISVSPFKVFV